MPHEPITRRQLLKALLAAGGGLTASAMLPAKWLKPVVKSGVLPVHAQSSIIGALIPQIQGILRDGILDLDIVVVVSPEITSTDGLSALTIDDGIPLQLGVAPQGGIGIPDIPVKMAYHTTKGTVKNPKPALPRTVKSNEFGYADFGQQLWTVGASPWSFELKFTAPGCVSSKVYINSKK
jgi:hypothetical protein